MAIRSLTRFLPPVFVAAGALSVYLLLSSSSYNPDGLRVFPGLHRVFARTDAGPVYEIRDGFAGYRPPNYVRANVQKHFLYPLLAHEVYSLQLKAEENRAGGVAGDESGSSSQASGPRSSGAARTLSLTSGLRPLQVASALWSGLTLILFGVAIVTAGAGSWVAATATAGLAFSTAFSAMATNIAEVVPAMPGLVLGLLFIQLGMRNSEPGESRRTTAPGSWPLFILAGVCLGLSAACYLATVFIAAALTVLLLSKRRPGWAGALFGAMAVTVALVYAAILRSAGYDTAGSLWQAMTLMQTHGTYGTPRLTNAITVVFGFANSLFPVLPEDFAGLRHLLAALRSSSRIDYLRLASIPLIAALGIALLAGLLRVRSRLEPAGRRAAEIGVAVFAGALVSSLIWDPYHPKLWMYSNIGLWMAAAAFIGLEAREWRTWRVAGEARRGRSVARLAVCALGCLTALAVVASNLALMIRQHAANPGWVAAREVARRVAAGAARDGSDRLLLGGWEPDFDYLTLLLWDTSLVSLPDAILENGRDELRFRSAVAERVAGVLGRGGTVHAMNLFNQPPDEIRRSYVDRLGVPGFPAWLDSLRPGARRVWRDERTGDDLYELN